MNKAIYSILFIIIVESARCQLKNCPYGWMQFGPSCYLFHRSPLSWLDAASYCLVHSAHLAMIESNSEKDFINGMLQNLPGEYWLDGVDDQAEGLWEWATTGQKIANDLWWPGEPNSMTVAENCMETSNGYRGYWNDDDCRKQEYCICEKLL